MDEKKQSQTREKPGVTDVSIIHDFDYVTVVGCSDPTYFDSWSPGKIASNMWNGQAGNKVMFINQGIRQLRMYPETTPDKSIRRIFLIFTDAYERALLEKVKEYVESRYGAEYAELASIAELVAFIERRPQKRRRIKQMDFFSHGVVHHVEFGYGTRYRETCSLGDSQARKFPLNAFDEEARIYSYACRTGVGVDKSSFDHGDDPQYDQSLAQIIADSAEVRVWAFPRRSNYDETYGTGEDRERVIETEVKMREYEINLNSYKIQLSAYQQRIKASEGQQTYSGPSPQPPIKPYSDSDELLVFRSRERSWNQKQLNVPLDPYGAVRGVRSGDTPTGLPMELRGFTPKAWQ